MNLKKYFTLKANFKYIAWFLWVLIIANALTDFLGPFLNSEKQVNKSDYNNLVTYFLVFFALIECVVTVLIRYFALIRPAKKGTCSPFKDPFRFLLVGVINWLCAGSIVLYGPIVFYMSGQVWPVILFGCFGIFLFLFHSPRLGQFKYELNGSPDIVDVSFPQIK